MTSKGPRASVDLAAASAIGKAAGSLSKSIKGPKKPKEAKKLKEKKAAASKPAVDKKLEPPMVGPGATHSRNANTGRPVKLSPAQKKAVSKSETNRVALSPAVDLTGPQFR